MLLFLQQKCIIFTNMQIDRGNKMKKQLLSIRNSELFSGISAEEIGILLEEMPVKERTYNKGNFIFYAGDAVRYVHIVLSGVVHIIQEDYWGNRNILTQVRPMQLQQSALWLWNRQMFFVLMSVSFFWLPVY